MHDIVYDPKMLQGHYRSLTYFMTSEFTVTFVVSWTLFMTQQGHRVSRGRLDLINEPKVTMNSSRFDLVYDPKKSRGQ